MGFEVGEVDEFEGGGVGGGKDDGWRAAGVESVLPTSDAQAPEVPGLQSGEVVFRGGRDEVVALGDGEREEFGGHFSADDMDAVVTGTCPAIAVPVEASPWMPATNLQLSAQHVGWHVAAS